MPVPKVIGRGIQSKIINQESGKRLYASDVPYQEQMQKLSQKYVLSVQLQKESEFKKPYLEDDYGEMEHFFYPGPEDPKFPPGPGGFDDGCKVGFESAGAVEGWRICAPSDDCAGWVFTCAHKIVSFACGNCQIARMEQLPGDRLLVVICSGEDKLSVKFATNDGKSHTFEPNRSCLGPGADPGCTSCADCKTYPPVIHFTTQQMSVGGTQNLNATGGGGGPYTWKLSAGGGTLSKTLTNSGENTVYTAAGSNANCTNNPTIEVTDYCGNKATLKIAVNGAGATGAAYDIMTCSVSGGAVHYVSTGFKCDNSPATGFNGCSSGFPPLTCPGGPPCDTSVNCGPTGKKHSCAVGTYDDRTAALLAAGCCPAGLL